MLSPPDLVVQADVAAMTDRARRFLLDRQQADGSWHDFFLPAGESDGWVTGYVGHALAASGDPRGMAAARRGWAHLLTAQKPDGGWGYNALTPSDADSIVWALRLAEAIGAEGSDAARRGQAVLDTHRRGGGIATYAHESGPRDYVGLPATVDFRAWTAPHVCVTAAAAALDTSLGEWLILRQEADGHWPSYWWFDPGYATAEAVEALGPGPARDRAMAFARQRLRDLLADPTPSAFGLAQAMRILGAATPQAALAAVAARQDANGSWSASARLRVPAPDCVMPTDDAAWKPWRGLRAMPTSLAQVLEMTFTITSLDHRRAFTTATMLRALGAVGG